LAKRIVGSGEHDSLIPKIFVLVSIMLHQSAKNAFAIFPQACLPDIDFLGDSPILLINAK
jgi:hypothetical protein